MQVCKPRMLLLVLLLALVAFAGLAWTNYRFTQSNPGGNDFLPRWVGTRLFLLDRQGPYSEKTTLAIQQAMYGRDTEAGEDVAYFAYPFYGMLVFAPFAAIADYALARALWMTALELSLVLTAVLGITLSRWRPDRITLVLFLLFSITWYHGARPLINGNAAILVALGLTAALWLLRQGQDTLAGILLALSTIKPQMVILLAPYLLIWAISKKRYGVLGGFALTLLVLMALSFWLQPGWLLANIAQVLSYPGYTPAGTPAAIFADWWGAAGSLFGWTLSGLLFLVLLWEWWLSFGKGFEWLLWTASLTLVVTMLSGVPTTTANTAALLPVLPMMFAVWERRTGRATKRFSWITLGLLFFGIWLLFFASMRPALQYNEHPAMLLPMPLITLTGLYWLRWWALGANEISYPAQRAQRRARRGRSS